MLRRQSDTRRDKTAFALNHRYDNLLYGSTGGGIAPSTHDFRLTLASSNPVYSPQDATPSSTTGNVVSFAAAHGWVSGTISTVAATIAGLTAGTRYYLRAASSTSVTFHATAANAISNTSPITLSASMTAKVLVTGVSNTSIYLTPYIGQTTNVYDGVSAWVPLTSGEISLALGVLVANSHYSIFAYANSGALALEKGTAWSSVNPGGIIPPDCTTQDGVVVKTADHTRRLVGVIRADTTATTVDDGGGVTAWAGAQRFLWNQQNRVPTWLTVIGAGNSTYGLTTARQAGNNSGAKVELVIGAMDDAIDAFVAMYAVCSNASAAGCTSIGLDGLSAAKGSFYQQDGSGVAALATAIFAKWIGRPSLGYHSLQWVEFNATANNVTYYYASSPTLQSGLTAWVRM